MYSDYDINSLYGWQARSMTYEGFTGITILPLDDPDNYDHCWGVHLPFCENMIPYINWCDEMVDGYECDGRGRKLWFKEEKYRTMFLLRWS